MSQTEPTIKTLLERIDGMEARLTTLINLRADALEKQFTLMNRKVG